MPVEHELKTWPNYWDAVERGDKPFEVRRDDRGFQKGDILRLLKYDPDRGYIKDRVTHVAFELRRRITFVLTGGQFGIEPGYVVLGLGPAEALEKGEGNADRNAN